MNYQQYISEMAKASNTVYHFSDIVSLANIIVNDSLDSRWGDFSFTRNRNFLRDNQRNSLGAPMFAGRIDAALVFDIADLTSGLYRNVKSPKPFNFDGSEGHSTRHLSPDKLATFSMPDGRNYEDVYGNEYEEQIKSKKRLSPDQIIQNTDAQYHINPVRPVVQKIMIDAKAFAWNTEIDPMLIVDQFSPTRRYQKLTEELAKYLGVTSEELNTIHRAVIVDFLINRYKTEVFVLQNFREIPWASFRPRVFGRDDVKFTKYGESE